MSLFSPLCVRRLSLTTLRQMILVKEIQIAGIFLDGYKLFEFQNSTQGLLSVSGGGVSEEKALELATMNIKKPINFGIVAGEKLLFSAGRATKTLSFAVSIQGTAPTSPPPPSLPSHAR